MGLIYHLVPADYYRSLPASDPYLPREYKQDGFIHCTKEPEWLLKVANSFYQSTPGEMWVLAIDESRVSAPIKYEPPEPGGHLFPHIYGPIDRRAIILVRSAQREADGTFEAV